LWSDLDPDVKTRLGQLERDSSTTHFVIGLAAFAVHLAAIAGRTNMVVGTHVSNRADAVLHEMQGYLSRLMPLCFELPAVGTFLDWLQAVQRQVAAVQAHAQLPREELWEDLRAIGSRPPNITVIFGGTSVSVGDRFADLDFKAHDHRFKGLALDTQGTGERAASMPWGLTLVLDANNAERTCEVTFDARIYDREKVRSFLQGYTHLLDRLSAEPDRPMADLLGIGK
jgi:non-ribosomal peptide synthetase component F